jgi:ABC-2 type transport system permease protein
MTALAHATPLAAAQPRRPSRIQSLRTLAGRRFALTARTPRELLVPLLTPVLFALVIAPALRTALHTSATYESYVAIGTIGLLVPLNTFFLGLGVIVDRENGAQRELLAAPVQRSLLVLSNLLVALAITGLQIATLVGLAVARRIHFDLHASHLLWFLTAVILLTIAMYGAAETLAARIPRQEEYIARIPAIAIAPWFLAGSLYPITAMPIALTWIARFLPLTHALALMRYGLNGDPTGLHAIWQMNNTTDMAALSLLTLTTFALLLTRIAIQTFNTTATS